MITIHTLIASSCALLSKLSKTTLFEAVLTSNFRAYCFHTSLVNGYSFAGYNFSTR